MELLKKHQYTILLLSLGLLLVVHPLLTDPDEFPKLLYLAFLLIVFAGALVILFERRRSRTFGLLFGVPTVIGVIRYALDPGILPRLPDLVLSTFPIFFLVYAAMSILRRVFRKPTVSGDSINGAFCVYLLIALAFGHAYCLVEGIWPKSFLITENMGKLPVDSGRQHALLTYFSLVTITTVGYGDILPLSNAARTIASVEAVFGQFFVAVIVAQLIALKVSASLKPPISDGPDEPNPG